MAVLDERVTPDRAHEERIFDGDFHLHIPPEAIYEYIEDDRMRRRLEDDGPPPVNSRPVTANYARQKSPSVPFDRVHGVAANRDEIREVCDELAIDAAVVQPGTNLPLHRTNYPKVVNALTRAYNDYLIEEVVDVANEIYSAPFIPHWDVDFAVEELDRIGREPGFVAAQNWMNTYKLWGDIGYDPIFEKLTELDLNLICHTTGTGMSRQRTSESVRTATEYQVVHMGYAVLANAANMIMTGVFDAFPDLEVSFQEAGTNWIPYLGYRLTELYQRNVDEIVLAERFQRMDQEELERLPHEYIFDNMYAATQPVTYPNIPRTDHVEGLLAACQAERTLMYTSDWPHIGLDPVNWVYETPCIDDELRAKILFENSESFCRMPGGSA